MSNINKVFLCGFVGKDADVKTFENGTVVTFSLATSRGGFTTKDGKEIKEVTYWHNIVANRPGITTLAGMVKKGDLVTVEGELRYRTYVGTDGVQRAVTEIYADNIIPPKKPVEKSPCTAARRICVTGE